MVIHLGTWLRETGACRHGGHLHIDHLTPQRLLPLQLIVAFLAVTALSVVTYLSIAAGLQHDLRHPPDAAVRLTIFVALVLASPGAVPQLVYDLGRFDPNFDS